MSDTQTNLVHDAVLVLLDELNGGNRRAVAREILEAVSAEHRTVQQAFWSALLLAQIDYASMCFDERNKAAVQLASKVAELAKANNWDMGLPRI